MGVYNNDGGNMLQRNNYDSVKSISSSKPRVGYNNKKCYCCHKKVRIQFYYRRLKSVLKDLREKKSHEEWGDIAFTELGEVCDDDFFIIHKHKDLLND